MKKKKLFVNDTMKYLQRVFFISLFLLILPFLRITSAQTPPPESFTEDLVNILFSPGADDPQLEEDVRYVEEVGNSYLSGTPIPTSGPSGAPNLSGTPTAVSGSPAVSPPATGDASSILYWAKQVNSRLEICNMGGFCRNVKPITNSGYTTVSRQGLDNGVGATGRYWCTNLMIDSEGLAGKKGLSASKGHQAVVNMVAYWKTGADNRTYLFYGKTKTQPFDTTVSQRTQVLKAVKPGCAMFQMSQNGVHTGKEHVAVVDSITLSPSGDGKIVTLDANGSKKSYTFAVSGYQVKNTFYEYLAFGCYK